MLCRNSSQDSSFFPCSFLSLRILLLGIRKPLPLPMLPWYFHLMGIKLSCVITAHREGAEWLTMAMSSVLSALHFAQLSPSQVEIIVVFDDSDEITKGTQFPADFPIRRFSVQHGELSSSRNYALLKSRGMYLAFLDADDMWGRSWIKEALEKSTQHMNEKIVIHPQFNVFFESNDLGNRLVIRQQLNAPISNNPLLDLAFSNLWTAHSFALRSVFLETPFVPNQPEQGIGFEDWNFNVQTTALGVRHLIADGAWHFIRVKKGQASMNYRWTEADLAVESSGIFFDSAYRERP